MRMPGMSSQSNVDLLEAAADQAIAACGGDAREAVKALIVANQFLDAELEKTARCGSRQVIREKNYPRHPRRCCLIGRTV
jgi:hypothetical protein